MQHATDSDLALALAIAENSSQDDDFQHPSHTDQLFVLKSCGSFSGTRPHSKSKRPKKDNKTDQVLRRVHVNVQRERKAPRAENPGKENLNHSSKGCKNVELCDSAQGLKSRRNRERSRRSLEESCHEGELQGTNEVVQNCSPFAFNELSQHNASSERRIPTNDAYFSEDECSLPPDDGGCEMAGLSSPQMAQQRMEEAVSLAGDKERPEDVVRLDEEDPNIVFSVSKRKVELGNSSSRENEIDSRCHLSQSQDVSLPSTDPNSQSRFSALLRLCVDATRGNTQPETGLDEASAVTSPKASSNAEVQEPCEEEEDVMSLMTQARDLAPNFIDGCQLDQETRNSPMTHENGSLTNQFATQRACVDLKTQSGALVSGSGDPSSNFITDKETVAVCSDSEKKNFDLFFQCPICGKCFLEMCHEQREVHTNSCLDSIVEDPVKFQGGNSTDECSRGVSVYNAAPVLRWLESLDLSRYANVFIHEEIDWDTLKWLTEEDLSVLGITALGPRRKIFRSLQQLQTETHEGLTENVIQKQQIDSTANQGKPNASGTPTITDYFGPPHNLSRALSSNPQVPPDFDRGRARCSSEVAVKKRISANTCDIPKWMDIPGTKFRVDAFHHLRGDCSHWFLTHFHTDHYQGLTRGFRYGNVYCSSITAQLVNARIGVPWDRLKILPLNKKVEIEGVNVTFIDANHCPGAVMILFEPRLGKVVLHTGDFRFCEEMANDHMLQMCKVHTLILDTTYCKPQYDFPKQEVVIQFVIDAIQAEAFNPNTLFLIGTYTIGKERIFLEVAKVLQKKVYVGAAKFRILQCMHFSDEEMQWLTINDQESCIHVVPLWTISSFKRMKFVSNHYHGRYNSIVSFSPTGWNFGRGKKRTPGRRWQQGTIVRYEVPYSEHCSFKELRDFVEFIAPVDIIPSVHNTSSEAADAMVAVLLNEEEGT